MLSNVKSENLPRWDRELVVRRTAAFGAVVGLVLTIIWAVTGAPYYWPGWYWFALILPLVVDRSIRRALHAHISRPLALHLTISLLITAALVFVWLLASRKYFWPIWPILGLGVVFAGHAILLPWIARDQDHELAQRVDTLTQSRSDALDLQDAEIRRVERDLHDGAQARLVALGLSLGMADELLDSDPVEARRLLAEARNTATQALGDLRAVVRGILPPVLADRGLIGAVEALVVASPIPIDVRFMLSDERLPAPLESATYFAIAEALTNVAKHSEARAAWVRVTQADGLLSMVVKDDGRGGADPDKGTGLRGIERRLRAFDGTLTVNSPQGGPTIMTMEVPCELSSPKT